MGSEDGTAFKVRCERAGLLTALQAANAVVPSNSTKPILTNLQLKVGDDGMEVVATDMQVGLRAVVRRIDVDARGEVVVPARQLVAMLKESVSADVSLEVSKSADRSQLEIVLADGEYSIPAVVGETFPAIGSFPKDGGRITIPGDQLDRMIRKTIFAVDKDRTSAVLGGVYLASGEGELVLAGTDGKILCEAVYRRENLTENMKAIIPAGTIGHISRILSSGSPGEVELSIAGKLVFVRVVVASGEEGAAGSIQVELTSRLVDGSYPAYRNALPCEGQEKIVFETAALSSAVRRTALMTSSKSRGIVAELADGKAILRNMISTGGKAEIPVPCKYEGGGLRVGLNAGYLSSILRVYEASEVTIELNGAGKGMIMREPGMTYLVMPISLPN